MSWSLEFDNPVPGLRTLREAATYIVRLPRAEQKKEHWLTAVEMLMMAAERGLPVMFARIAMLRALDHGKPQPAQEPRRKAAKTFNLITGARAPKRSTAPRR